MKKILILTLVLGGLVLTSCDKNDTRPSTDNSSSTSETILKEEIIEEDIIHEDIIYGDNN